VKEVKKFNSTNFLREPTDSHSMWHPKKAESLHLH